MHAADSMQAALLPCLLHHTHLRMQAQLMHALQGALLSSREEHTQPFNNPRAQGTEGTVCRYTNCLQCCPRQAMRLCASVHSSLLLGPQRCVHVKIQLLWFQVRQERVCTGRCQGSESFKCGLHRCAWVHMYVSVCVPLGMQVRF